jgi:cell division protein FtsB
MLRNITLSAIIILIAFFTVFGRNGLYELVQFQNQNGELQRKLLSLRNMITQEKDLMFGLDNSPEYFEQVAREDLALSKQNEIIYVFDPASNKKELEKISQTNNSGNSRE